MGIESPALCTAYIGLFPSIPHHVGTWRSHNNDQQMEQWVVHQEMNCKQNDKQLSQWLERSQNQEGHGKEAWQIKTSKHHIWRPTQCTSMIFSNICPYLHRNASSVSQINSFRKQIIIYMRYTESRYNSQNYQVSEWSSKWSGPFKWILHII